MSFYSGSVTHRIFPLLILPLVTIEPSPIMTLVVTKPPLNICLLFQICPLNVNIHHKFIFHPKKEECVNGDRNWYRKILSLSVDAVIPPTTQSSRVSLWFTVKGGHLNWFPPFRLAFWTGKHWVYSIGHVAYFPHVPLVHTPCGNNSNQCQNNWNTA